MSRIPSRRRREVSLAFGFFVSGFVLKLWYRDLGYGADDTVEEGSFSTGPIQRGP
jgi:hypothetical protein